MLRAMSYMEQVATALIRLSPLAAVMAMPLSPQMPWTPIRSRSTTLCRPRKSTAALKSSVKISGEPTSRTSPPLSPVNDGSNARVTKPRRASSLA